MASGAYLNPVYPYSCPDPFALKYCGEYWIYCTGLQPDGRCFGILHSADLVHWRWVSGAMEPLPGDNPCYWAPEVTYRDGVFYLYYSVGDEEHMQIRVAAAGNPDGPFVDSGHRLTSEKFAIDPHVFEDDDGQVYLFYAADFLDVERAGTGTVMDRLLDSFTLAGRPRPVTRARFDWQIYHPHRPEKGGLRWHTLEGPFVLKHNGRYYQMFSGGNWQNDTYGVGYAVTDSLDAPGEWDQHCDGEKVLPVLRSLPEAGVIGPGHNSVVRGPDNRQLYCIYHRWDSGTSQRVLAVDPLGWEGDELRVYGPTFTPQPLPPAPTVSGFEAFHAVRGTWRVEGKTARLQPEGGEATAELACPTDRFILEISLREVGEAESGSRIGLRLLEGSGEILSAALLPGRNQAVVETQVGAQTLALPPGFNPQAYHLLRIKSEAGGAEVSLDGRRMAWELPRIDPVDRVQFYTEGVDVEFAGFALAVGR